MPRRNLTGSVIDKSATGNTLFIEPTCVAKHYDELQLLKISEENEVYRILYTLTAMVAASLDIMNENIETVEKLDFIVTVQLTPFAKRTYSAFSLLCSYFAHKRALSS